MLHKIRKVFEDSVPGTDGESRPEGGMELHPYPPRGVPSSPAVRPQGDSRAPGVAEAGQGLGLDFVEERANTSLNPDTGRGEAWLSGPPAPWPARREKEDS